MERTKGSLMASFIAFAACVALSTAECDAAPTGGAPKAKGFEFQKGMCYVTLDRERYSAKGSDESLAALAKTGTDWVALVVTWYQEKAYTTKIFSTDKTPSDESLTHAIGQIHALGKKVMLKPHLDLIGTEGGSWRGEISCPTDMEWEEWFNNYANFILHYAKLAEENKVELYCIGTELSCVATTKERMWREKIIKPVRRIYKGPLTYAANWNDEYQRVKFWDALDYVGIDAYFPLSDKEWPNLDEIKAGWDKWVKDIEEFQKRVAKPVIFPEVGYCSAGGTAKTPWEEITSGRANLELQRDCYEALFQVFWEKPWFYGVYWWKWGTDVRFGGPSNKGYSPQNKPALNTIKKWYGKPVPSKNPSIFKKTAK